MARLKIPFYPVIGNHDHDKEILSDKASAHTYEKYFGPTYYAFQLGKVYCIVSKIINNQRIKSIDVE